MKYRCSVIFLTVKFSLAPESCVFFEPKFVNAVVLPYPLQLTPMIRPLIDRARVVVVSYPDSELSEVFFIVVA